jgi:8-oxo-dGTP pyrophosphatase MutT (NUDIX family)
MAKWQKISGKIVYRNKFYTVEEDIVTRPDGGEGVYSVVRKGPFCVVIAVDDLRRVYFIKQFRYPTQKYAWELIKGGNENRVSIIAGKIELEEEAGLQAEHWEELGGLDPAASYCDEIGHTLIATGLKKAKANAQEEEGIVECQPFSREQYEEMIKKGELHDSQSIGALYMARLKGFID